MQKKDCNKCKKNLELAYFDFSKPGILRNKCKVCRYEEKKERLNERKEETIKNQLTIIDKICIQCEKSKPISNFTKLITNKDGFCSYCKECVKINRNNKNITCFEDDTKSYRTCKECEKEKFITEFRKSKDGHYFTCNNCWPEPEWNKEKQKISEKKYVENNKEKIKEKWRVQGKKINRRIRNSINKRIRSFLFSKKKKSLEYTGCSIDFLKKWFEFNFEENMNWENYGKWHIDHIIPCNNFDFNNQEHINTCFNWKNLRPCWGLENIVKGDKIDNNLINKFKKRALLFESQNPLLTI